MLSPRPAARNLPAYCPPLGGRTGLRLDFNENTIGCSPRVMERIRGLDMDYLSRYPEREPVEAIVAAHLEVAPSELLLTNGVDEAIHLVCEAYLDPGDEALIIVPTFAMYEICAAATGAHAIPIPAKDDFAFPIEAILARITPRTRVIMLANPNNPTGAVAQQAELMRLATAARGAALLVDEAYFEFCRETLLGRWKECPNLFVARTFSKAYGLAGLRVGVLMGNAAQMAVLRRAASPYNVNSIALACLPDALADQQFLNRYVAEVCEGRERLQQELSALGIRYWPSRANFVLLHFGEVAPLFVSGMRELGILVRDRSHDYGCEGCVRITIGSRSQTDQLLGALRQGVDELGLPEKAEI